MRIYTNADYTLKIGTSAQENDELISAASQTDIWLHLEKFSSPHGILSWSGSTSPNTEIIIWAAQLVKEHSGKKSKYLQNIGVMYIPVKFVKKTGIIGEVHLVKKYSIVKVS